MAVVYVAVACRWFLGLVFLAAGLAKVRQQQKFTAVDRYGILPRPLVHPVAVALPIVEVALAIALLAGILPVLAGAAVALVLCAFSWAIAVNLRRGRRFDCGCGLDTDTQISWTMVIRNALLVLLALTVVVAPVALAALPGPSVSDPASEVPFSRLLAMPMLAILLAAFARLLGSGTWRTVMGPSHRGTAGGEPRSHPTTGQPALEVISVGGAQRINGNQGVL